MPSGMDAAAGELNLWSKAFVDFFLNHPRVAEMNCILKQTIPRFMCVRVCVRPVKFFFLRMV